MIAAMHKREEKEWDKMRLPAKNIYALQIIKATTINGDDKMDDHKPATSE
jgi:hypothetical protein